MNVYNFETPQRQSIKGIIVILFGALFESLKRIVPVILITYFAVQGKEKTNDSSSLIPVLIVVGLFLYFLIYSILKYRNFKFHINDDYFFLNEGILNKGKTSIPKSKIQNVYIKQNLIQQIINVVSVSIETAGDDSAEIEIKALNNDKANDLKKQLLNTVAVSEITNSFTSVENIYFKASTKKLLLEGISENHLKSLWLILIFIAGIYNDLKDFIKTANLKSKFGDYFNLSDEQLFTAILLNISLVLSLIFVSFFYSLIRVFFVNFNLKIVENLKGLEISKGLFNKISLNLNESRIQTATIKTNSFKKTLGLYNVKFTQAMLNKKQKGNFSIIGLGKNKALELIDKFYPKVFENEQHSKPEHYFIRIKTMRWVALLILLNIIFFFISKELFLLNILLIPFVFFNIKAKYRKAKYSFNDKYLTVNKGGLIETITQVMELHKIQAVKIKQSIFQKRRGIASVILYSASEELTIPYITEINAKQISNYMLYKVEREDKNWM